MQDTSRQRRAWAAYYYSNGRNVSATCREFGVSRPTLYLWRKRYETANPQKPLKSRSRRPHTKRTRTWSKHHLAVLSELMLNNPTWGRSRMRLALAGNDWLVSEATVGRMLQVVRHHCPVCNRKGGRHDVRTHETHRDLLYTGLELALQIALARSNQTRKQQARESAG